MTGRTSTRLGAVVLAIALFAFGAQVSSAAAAPRTLDREVLRQVAYINHFRVSHRLPVVRLDVELTNSATWMANDMATKSYFAHRDSKRRGWYRRLGDFRYPIRTTWTGENLAAGHADAATTYQQWLHSAPHRHNLLNPHFRAIGIARVYVPGSPYGWYWVTDFGSKRTQPLCVVKHHRPRCA